MMWSRSQIISVLFIYLFFSIIWYVKALNYKKKKKKQYTSCPMLSAAWINHKQITYSKCKYLQNLKDPHTYHYK